MAYERINDMPLDYQLCRYGKSKLLVRGPRKPLDRSYMAFIGATETFGKFVAEPFPELVEKKTGRRSINLGVANAGLDAFLKDRSILDICHGAQTTIIQIMGAQNMSNRFYSVHPRRNDRFLQASDLLKMIYPEVDFTEFSFTRHMLRELRAVSEKRFRSVEIELKAAWIARMQLLISGIPGRKILLNLADRRASCPDGVWAEPMFVDDAMIETLRVRVSDVLTIDITDAIMPDSVTGMQFPSLESAVAAGLPGPQFHDHVALNLIDAL